MDKDTESRYFRTSSFYLAAFLFSKGLELANIDQITSKKAQFVFVNSPQCESLTQNFNFSKENADEVLVDARKFVMSIKSLKDRLYQSYE